MLIRSAQLPLLIDRLAEDDDIASDAASDAKMTFAHSDLPPIVDPLHELRRSLEGVVDPRVVTHALRKAAVVIGSGKLAEIERAQNLGNGFLALARGAKSRAQEHVVEDPKPGSAAAEMSVSHIDNLLKTPLRPVVEAARSKNMFIVVPEELDDDSRAEYERLCGVPVVGMNDGKQHSGVAIHMGDIKSVAAAVPKGDLNPGLGDAKAQSWVEGNKWREYLIAKDFMPQTVNAADMLRDNPTFNALRRRVLEQIDDYRQHPTRQKEARLQRATHMLFQQFTELSKALFPSGAFIKYIGEFQTGDSGQVMHTGKQRQAGRAFVADLKAANAELGSKTRFNSSAMQNKLGESSRSPTHVVRSLLLNPSAVLVQERMAIAKTRDGFNHEIRVDVYSGVAVNNPPRYGVDYQPEATKRAVAFVQKFFDQKTEQWGSMSGGVDVAVLENGELAIIEFNFGTESGFIDPTTAALEGNVTVSRLQGAPTPFIRRLQDAFDADTSAQCAAIDAVIAEDPDKPDRAVGAATYFRDRLLENARRDSDEQTRASLRAITDRIKTIAPKEANDLLAVSEAYLNETISKR